MPDPFHIEWDYYMQAYRLHQRMTKVANYQAAAMLVQAISIATAHGRDIPRARSLLGFTHLLASLNGWPTPPDAQAVLATAMQDLAGLQGAGLLGKDLLASAANTLGSLSNASPVGEIMRAAIFYYAAAAAELDPTDYDNQWTVGTALLYVFKDFPGAYARYQDAHDLAQNVDAPNISRNSLKVDRGDRKFFMAPYVAQGNPVPDEINQAIALIEEAMLDGEKSSPDDSKWRRWNWSLGWAYYEARDYARSLTALLQIQNPHDLIIKNIIASYVGLGKVELAISMAAGFLARNPDYSLSIEDFWPYAEDARRDSWKGHLKAAGLPD
jgi:hypothetical protein